MPEPTSHTAGIVLSGVGAGTVSTVLGLDTGALFWAFLGAVCWQAVHPQITSRAEMVRSAAIAIISTVLGMFGSLWAAAAVLHFWPYFSQVPLDALIALPAFVLGLLGHKLLLRAADFISEFRKGGA